MKTKIDINRISPMMKHYLSLKEQYKDSILFFRLGDFYEMFFDDAELASRLLNLTLTGRDCGLEGRAPMCGIPYHSAESYISKLVDKGYKVAICEQLTTPSESKGMVDRDVVRVVTPGTKMDESMLKEEQNNYIASVIIDNNRAGISWCDISTGEFYLYETNAEDSVKIVEDLLISINPKEIISSEQAFMLSSDMLIVKNNELPKFQCYYNWAFDYNNAHKTLLKQLNVHSLDSFEIDGKKLAISSAGALIEYLLETQKRALAHINKINLIKHNKYMFLDAHTRRNLEIIETIRDRKKKGSLLWTLDHTSTCMGARMLRKWIDQPLINSNEINLRLDAVEEILQSSKRVELLEALPRIRDLERLAGKIAYGSLNPKDCVSISESINKLPEVKNILDSFSSKLFGKINNNIIIDHKLQDLLKDAIDENAPQILKEGGFIKDGYNSELDGLRDAKINGEKWLANIEREEKELTGIKNLKIGFNKVFGYYIEVSKGSIDKVPFRYVRKQTLTNCERYITDELKNIEDKILNAEMTSINIELRIFNEIKEYLTTKIHLLQNIAESIAICDTLCSLAIVAKNNSYNKPVINDNINHIFIKSGRHPVVEAMLSHNDYVSNDTLLDNNDNTTMIITGPNMAGKSTYMRQVALITLMAHIGSFVPAVSAEVSITDRIFTRVGASDDLAYGQSTFMVEMIETAGILNNATNKSLIVLDEIGRGTSTYDGLSIAWSVMEYINSVLKAKTMFATHYHELTELEGALRGVVNYKILVNEHKGGIVLLHRIVKGGTNKSFGIEVAQLAGIPQDVIIRAKQIAKALESNDIYKDNNCIMLGALGLEDSKLKQISMLPDNKNIDIIDTLKETNIDNITPIQAFMLLSELVKKAKDE